jgi:murein DD-endopeptidase MepM/ murein hydrolase activator NlpD
VKRARRRPDVWILAAFVCFAAGMVVGWWLRGGPPEPSLLRDAQTTVESAKPEVRARTGEREPSATAISPPAMAASGPSDGAVAELTLRRLRIPIDNADVGRWKRMFAEERDGRQHEAVDILAPRGTPVHAVEDGTVAKLFVSKAGGNTVYQFDPTSRFCYYYAHLDRYAAGLKERGQIKRGDIVGYVGTSGNAAPSTPHLHFAIFALDADRRWWKGRPLDPYLIFQDARS